MFLQLNLGHYAEQSDQVQQSESLPWYSTSASSQVAMAEAEGQHNFVSYCVQKADRPDALYMLFWLQNTRNEHTLAMVVSVSSLRTSSSANCLMQCADA